MSRNCGRTATAHPDNCDTELSRNEQQAYDRVVRRIDDLWSYRPGVDQPRPDAVSARCRLQHLESSAVLRHPPRDRRPAPAAHHPQGPLAFLVDPRGTTPLHVA